MPRNGKTYSITLAPDIAQDVEQAAQQAGISRSAFIRDAIERQVIKNRFHQRRQQAEADVRRMGITPEDVPRLVEEARAEMATEKASASATRA